MDGAIAACRSSAGLDPHHVRGFVVLGNALRKAGDLDAALAAYREALRIDPSDARVHANLGIALGAKGDFDGSVEALRRAAQLDPGLRGIGFALAHAERFAELHARLPGVLAGRDTPTTAAEWLTFAEMCSGTGDYASAARFWREAFEADPRLAADVGAGHRYNAACAAARAGSEWHEQARAWLREDLAAWGVAPVAAAAVARTLRHWKADPDLAAVRDGEGVPAEWRDLWADVDALLARAEEAAK